MLARRYSLPTPLIARFAGQKHRSNHLLLISRPSSLSHDRFAVIISKKVYPSAVDRHTLKRLIHLSLTSSVNQPPYYDYVVIIHPHPPSPDVIGADVVNIINNLKSKI